MIPYGHQTISAADIRAVVRVLKSKWLTQGPMIGQFEQALADYCGAKYAVVLASGTAALHGAYYAAGLSSGDEFITSPLTFAATANAGLYLGARPVFADIDDQGNLDPTETEKKISKKTKMIVAVDYAGHPAQLAALQKIARANNLVLIEDACHALGARYHGQKIGSVSDLNVFSFHPVKSITTGEGGAVLTNNKKYCERLRLFRTHGITKEPTLFKNKNPGDWYMEMQELGFNYRLTDIQAALGVSQLKKLDRFVTVRKKMARRYHQGLMDLSACLELPGEAQGFASSWHLYVIRLKGQLVNKRALIFKKLRSAGIGVQVHYLPVYLHPYYQRLGYQKGSCPRAEAFYEATISLPIFPTLSKQDLNFIIKKIHSIVKNYV